MSKKLTFAGSDNIAISDKDRVLTYNELDRIISFHRKKIDAKGVGNHRVLIKGHVDKTIEDFAWLDAVWLGGGTSVTINERYSDQEIKNFIKDYNPVAIIEENNVKVLGDTSVEHNIPEGVVGAMKTSGTTGTKTYKFYNFWRSPGYRRAAGDQGVTIDSGMNLVRMALPTIPPVFGEIGSFDSSYPQYNYLICRQMGGHFHIINEDDDIIVELNKHRINYIATWPNAVKHQIINKCNPGDIKHLKGIQLAGQPCPLDLLKDMRRYFQGCRFVNLFGSAEADLYLVAFNEEGDDFQDFYKFKVMKDLADMKIVDEVMYYQYDNKDWMTDGDGGEWLPDGRVLFNGRVNEDYLTKDTGVKVWCKPVESQITDIEGVDQAYMVRKDGIKFVMFYTGTAKIDIIINSLSKLTKYKQPDTVFHVDDKFFYTQSKLSRHTLYRSVEEFPEYIISSSEIAVLGTLNSK